MNMIELTKIDTNNGQRDKILVNTLYITLIESFTHTKFHTNQTENAKTTIEIHNNDRCIFVTETYQQIKKRINQKPNTKKLNKFDNLGIQ